MAVPYTFALATSNIPLANLDANFATPITLGNTSILLGNTVTTLNNMTMANVVITNSSSQPLAWAGGNVTITASGDTNVTLPASGAITLVRQGNVSTSGLTTSTATLLGRTTATTGAIEQITVGTGLRLSSGVLKSGLGGGSLITELAVANTETQLAVYTCVANELAAGTTFSVSAWANQSGSNAATPIIRVRIGTTTLTGNIAATLTGLSGSAGGSPTHKFEGHVTIRSAGASGVAIGSLEQRRLAAGTVTDDMNVPTTTVVVDTTAVNIVELTFISGNSANTYTFEEAAVVKVVA